MDKLDFNAEQYRRASGHQKEWGKEIIGQLPLSGYERIIDLGCGDGMLTAELAARVPAGFVLGIDSSDGMIEAAAKLASDNLSFSRMDINDMDFVEAFDVAFSNATLHWIKDHRRMLEAVMRSLRPCGWARFNFAAAGTGKPFDEAVGQVMKRPLFAAAFNDFQWPWYMPAGEEYDELVRSAGFREAKVWSENKDRWFDNSDVMIRWVDQPCLIPFLAVLPPADRQRFREEVVEEITRRTVGADGRCFVPFRRINLLARK